MVDGDGIAVNWDSVKLLGATEVSLSTAPMWNSQVHAWPRGDNAGDTGGEAWRYREIGRPSVDMWNH
jgi:hypothetical protein